jgi:Tat protein translocase TatC
MWQAALNKVFKVREKVALNLTPDDEEKPFLDHLEDLRKMFVRIAVTLLITMLVSFGFYKDLFKIVTAPLYFAGIVSTQDEAEKFLNTLGFQDGFMIVVNLTLIASVIISFPLLLLFLLQFVLPGLRANEKKVLFPGLAIGFGLFLTGIFFSYFLVLPRALEFFHSFNQGLGVGILGGLKEYITFATRFILIFGISFELPVVVMALVKLDFLSYKVMTGTRKHAIVGIAIFSAVITPTQDVLTLALLAVPLYFLYEICIWLAYFLEKKERQAYPEFYAERDKDEAELEKEIDDWDKEGYTPWFSDEEDKDIEDEYQQKAKSDDTPATEPTTPTDSDEVEPSTAPTPSEKTLEELAREDEQSSPTVTPTPPPETDTNGADPSRNQD